jgi:hypothetical protein
MNYMRRGQADIGGALVYLQCPLAILASKKGGGNLRSARILACTGFIEMSGRRPFPFSMV